MATRDDDCDLNHDELSSLARVLLVMEPMAEYLTPTTLQSDALVLARAVKRMAGIEGKVMQVEGKLHFGGNLRAVEAPTDGGSSR